MIAKIYVLKCHNKTLSEKLFWSGQAQNEIYSWNYKYSFSFTKLSNMITMLSNDKYVGNVTLRYYMT